MEFRECIKIKFDTEAEALKRIKKIKKDAKKSRRFRKIVGAKQDRVRKMATYQCRFCSKWHTTSEKQRNK